MELEQDSHTVGPLPRCTFKRWESREEDVPYKHVRGTVLFDLSSVRINRDLFKKWDAASGLSYDAIPQVEVYGYILLTDDLGNKFYLFRRDRYDAKPVSLHDSESVILQKFELGSPRCLPKAFKLQLYLEDRIRGIVLVDDWKYVDCSTREDTYDADLFFKFDREHHFGRYKSCTLSVYFDYTIFQCAFLACVGVIVLKADEDASDECAEVNGTIYATSKVGDVSRFERVLFGRTWNLNFGSLLKLSTLAVPAYSSLEIQAKLEVNGEKIDGGALEFEIFDWCHFPFEKEIVGKKYRVLVSVSWWHGINLPEYKLYEWRGADEEIEDPFSVREVSKQIPDMMKRMNIKGKSKKKSRGRKGNNSKNSDKDQSINIRSRPLALCKHERVRMHMDFLALVEVFSIFSCSYDGEGSSVYGKISCRDSLDYFVIFERGETEPYILHPHETLPLAQPSKCYMGPHFGIDLDLKDGEGREICYGYAGFGGNTTDSWFDRRICSVVRGKHGFAAVHYMIMGGAVEAKLNFTVESNNIGPAGRCQVYGRISGMYSNSRYCTPYEKKYYQSVLFKKDQSEFVDLVGDKIPLPKSSVAVSLNDLLIVIADICVLIDGKYVDTLKLTSTLKPGEQPAIDVQPIKAFRLSVSVVWVP